MTHLAVQIGVPGEEPAEELSRLLVEERLVAGTRLSSGLSYYWWDGAVREREYWTITAFTRREHLDALYTLLDDHHDDDLPGVTYTEIDARDEFLDWIDAQTA